MSARIQRVPRVLGHSARWRGDACSDNMHEPIRLTRSLSSLPFPSAFTLRPSYFAPNLILSPSPSYLSHPPVIMPRTDNTVVNTTRLARPTTQSNAHRNSTYSLSQSRRSSLHGATATALQISWLFKANIPRKRGAISHTQTHQKRTFFGMGEVIGVLANPAETLRSLTESKRLLEETRRELAEAKERSQLNPTHTFSPLPGFYDRPAELKALERALAGEPTFTVLFGASSVGKTALLRQVLTRNKYHVLHFDLRIAGFADLASLYMSLSQQMEAFFMSIAQDPEMPGYEEFEKQAWGFKHDRLTVERRLASGESSGSHCLSEIKTSDVARLLELFQSSLLYYWNFQPPLSSTSKSNATTGGDTTSAQSKARQPSRMKLFWGRRKKAEKKAAQAEENEGGEGKDQEKVPPVKKMPVFFIDEAHKLPALIRSTDAMKCLLDAMLVLTKQDRLCHVIHATSDPFYQTWLRQLNVMQHCRILTIGDYPKLDTRRYYRDHLLPNVPERLRPGLDFERLYEAFGGKLAHWQDYIQDYVNSNGKLEIKRFSHFLQAHALLNLHVIHSAQAPPPEAERADAPRTEGHTSAANASTQALHQPSMSGVPVNTSGNGFRIYSPLAVTADPHASPTTFQPTSSSSTPEPSATAAFTAIQLLKVMNRLAQPGTRALSYFMLCREMGVQAVDGMVRGRILDLRWTDPISREGWDPRIASMRFRESHVPPQRGAGSSGTAVNEEEAEEIPMHHHLRTPQRATGRFDLTESMHEEDMVALSDEEIIRETQRHWELQGAEEEEEIVGPKLVPTTPIMRFAMREVVQEYYDDEDDRTVSEYASLSGPDEY
ncbi:hypothetical protein BXZ70DRAFT_931783 [Cristinia sonorae]|uniref:AAA+ ATPase domain-containing protein n=1 Tax=Cristinia sonorae TaxID=1940300 RepID=A0A8K0UQF1_9AGAR|nr:hypothetical protein BXZ70DRAFT_931783 [Cristinia sonorae]